MPSSVEIVSHFVAFGKTRAPLRIAMGPRVQHEFVVRIMTAALYVFLLCLPTTQQS